MVSPGKIKLNQDKRFKGAFQECEVFFSEAEEVILDQWGWGWGLQGNENRCVAMEHKEPVPLCICCKSTNSLLGLSFLTC